MFDKPPVGEMKGWDRPVLTERARLLGMAEHITYFSAVLHRIEGSPEQAMQRVADSYEELMQGSGLSSRFLSMNSGTAVVVDRDHEASLLSVTVQNFRSAPDVAYYYRPSEQGIDYSALLNPHYSAKWQLLTAEEVGLYQAEMALNLARQVLNIENLDVIVHPISGKEVQ